MKSRNQLLVMLIFLVASVPASADLITEGFTFSVASGADQNTGTHYHSSTGGDFGNPAGLAEVGAFITEEVRGLSEYDLAIQGIAQSAFVTFDTFGTGLFPGSNDFPFDGIIDIFAYQGNNQEDISDYSIATSAFVASFDTAGLTVGDVFSFDILDIFNNAIDNSWSSLGIRLQTEDNEISGGAWTFQDFRLTTTDDTTLIPEPSTLTLFLLGIWGLHLLRRREVLG